MVEHTQNRPYKAKFENKAKDFCASSAAPAAVFVVVLFISWIGTKRTQKKELKTRKNTSPDLFLLSLVDLHASRPVQFAQYSNAFWTLCRYIDIDTGTHARFVYGNFNCVNAFVLHYYVCDLFFFSNWIHHDWIFVCKPTDRPTERNEQRSILNLRILYTKKIDYVCSTVYPCVVSKTTRDVCLLDWISMAGARILWE